MIQRGWREGVFVHDLVMNDSEGLERGGGVFVLDLMMNDSEGLQGAHCCPTPLDFVL